MSENPRKVKNQPSGEAAGAGRRADADASGQAEVEVRRPDDELEAGVRQRTAQLEAVVARLEREIARRKQAEESIRESEQRLQAILDNASAVIYVKDADGRFLLINRQFESLFHITREEIKGKTDHDLFPREAADAFRSNDLRVLDARASTEFEEVVPQEDGLHTYISIKFPLHTSSGVPYAVCGISTDITQRKRAEEKLGEAFAREAAARAEALSAETRLRGLIESAPDGIIIVDREGRITLANAQVENMFGYPLDELVGKRVELLVPDRFREVHVKHREGYLASPRTRPMGAGLDLYGRRRDGSEFPVEISLSPLWTEQGLLVTGIIRDITERKEAEAEIRKLNEDLRQRAVELEAANRELEAFSYSVSHDLRAPLRSMDGFSQALMEDYADELDERARDYLQRIRSAAQRMGHLIDDLLKLSRVTRFEMTRETVDMSQLATEIAAELAKSRPERKVEFAVQSGVVATGDPHLLRIVLENLLDNAWKFTSTQPEARIEFGAEERDGQTWYFVRDNGVGFDMEYADKLFAPFQRLHRPEEFPGTGIGLALIHRIVRRHGGSVRAEGATGQGATFYFTI